MKRKLTLAQAVEAAGILFELNTDPKGALAIAARAGLPCESEDEKSALLELNSLWTLLKSTEYKDKIRVEGGKIQLNRGKGALMALCANAINFFLAAVCIISMGLFMNGAEWAESVSQIFNLLLRFTNAMYIGLLQGVFAAFESDSNLYYFLQSIGYFVAPLLAVVSTHIGYIFGLNNVTFN